MTVCSVGHRIFDESFNASTRLIHDAVWALRETLLYRDLHLVPKLELGNQDNMLGERDPMNHRRTKRGRSIIIDIVLFLLYVSSYLVLSRRAFAAADQYGFEGFYFLTPQNTATWLSANGTLNCIYYPLIKFDNMVGTGRPIANEPMWGLN